MVRSAKRVWNHEARLGPHPSRRRFAAPQDEGRERSPGNGYQPAIKLAGWPAGRNIFFSFRNTRSAKPNQTGEVLRQKASFLTWSSMCHLACAPSLKKMTSPAV